MFSSEIGWSLGNSLDILVDIISGSSPPSIDELLIYL